MQVQLPIFILCLLIHAGIFQTSARQDRATRFGLGMLILFGTWAAWFAGYQLNTMEGNEAMLVSILGITLLNAPYYFPFLSFLVYAR